MVYEVVTTLDGAEVLRRAKQFFAERVPLNAAYPEREGPTYLTLRGQGQRVAFRMGDAGRHPDPRLHTFLRPGRGSLFVDLPLPAEHVA